MVKIDASSFPRMRYTGRRELARYRVPLIDEDRGNPFAEALPPELLNQDEILEYLTVRPDFNPADRELPDEIRIRKLSVLRKFFLPTEQHAVVFSNISNMIRTGYESKNPLKRPSTADRDALIQGAIEQLLVDDPEPYIAYSTSLFGSSRVGKSALTYRSFNYFPQVILHGEYNGRHFTQDQLVWLHIDCPPDGRTGGLVAFIFHAMDSVLPKSTLYSDFVDTNVKLDKLIASLYTVADLVGLGCLAIDETQVLSEIKTGIKRVKSARTKAEGAKIADNLINVLVTLDNKINVPTLYIGTPPARRVFGSKFHMMARTSGLGSMDLEPLALDSEEWGNFVSALCTYQIIRKPVDPIDIEKSLHECSAGIPGMAVTIFQQAQTYSIRQGFETLTPKILKTVFHEFFRDFEGPIRAILEGDLAGVELYEDITTVSKGNFPSIPTQTIAKATLSPKSRPATRKSSQKYSLPENQAKSEIHSGDDMTNDPEEPIRKEYIKDGTEFLD